METTLLETVGGAKQIERQGHPTRKPDPGEVLSDTAAAGVNYVDMAARQLRIDSFTMTDPKLLEDVYKNEMFLLDFEPLRDKVLPYFIEPRPLTPFIQQIKQGIIENHPAMVEFLGEAVKKDLFADASAYEARIKRMVHHTFLLNLLVEEMLADLDFMNATYRHFVAKRRELGVSDPLINSARVIYDATHSVFVTAKVLTTDLAITQYIGYRTRVHLGPKDLKGKNLGLFANVMEAIVTDLIRGFKENALAASILLTNPLRSLSVEGPRRDVKQRFVQGWTELYLIWNLAFMTGNLEDLDLTIPKLFITLLVNAKPEDFLYHRGVALWVTASVVLLNKLTYENRVGLGPFPDAARLLGKLSLNQAEAVNRASGGIASVGEGLLKRMQNKLVAILQGSGEKAA
jgi:hypothetical protein